MNRRAFTLVELLAALVILALVMAGTVMLVRSAAHSATRALRQADDERTIRTVALMVRHDLDAAVRADLTLLAPTRLALPRPVGWGLLCDQRAGMVLVAVADWHATRLPQEGRDVAWLLADSAAEVWDSVAIVATGTDHCPDGRAALTLSVAPLISTVAFLRVAEPVEWKIYSSGGSDWFGFEPADHSSSVQPFAGPLAPGAASFSLTASALDLVVALADAAPVTLSVPLTP